MVGVVIIDVHTTSESIAHRLLQTIATLHVYVPKTIYNKHDPKNTKTQILATIEYCRQLNVRHNKCLSQQIHKVGTEWIDWIING